MMRLRFFFDAGSGTCLWAGDDAARERFGYAIDAETLPLSPATRDALDTLIRRHDESIDWDDPAGPSPWTADEHERFSTDVRAVLDRVRSELGPGFDVVDESA